MLALASFVSMDISRHHYQAITTSSARHESKQPFLMLFRVTYFRDDYYFLSRHAFLHKLPADLACDDLRHYQIAACTGPCTGK